jgi:hypothetical protein
VAGQVASLTSTNNFINFCLDTKQPITDGKQVKTGSCNPAPMGQIPATTEMPSSKFTFPKNFGTVQANQGFTITMAIQGMQTGDFVNAQANYFAAPQQLNGKGQIIGHSHVVIQEVTSLKQTTPADPTQFAFFLGLNAAAQNGVLTAAVSNGLPAGTYRLSSINTAANHQPVVGPVAQHGSFDDIIYVSTPKGSCTCYGIDFICLFQFTVSDTGAAASNTTVPVAGVKVSSSSPVAKATSSPAAKAAGSASSATSQTSSTAASKATKA